MSRYTVELTEAQIRILITAINCLEVTYKDELPGNSPISGPEWAALDRASSALVRALP
jgi:hypothetical protein